MSMTRHERRMQQRQQELERKLDLSNMRSSMPEEYFRNKVAIMDKLQINGITVNELKQNYDNGFKDGFKAAGEPIVKGCFAAVCLALNEKYGFGRKRCCEVLNAVDQHLLYTLTSDDAIEQVWQKMGLKLEFKETFDRIQEVK